MKVIVMVLVVALISGLFLWFVFSQRATNLEEQMVDTAVEYDFSIDGETADYMESNDDVEEDFVSASDIENKDLTERDNSNTGSIQKKETVAQSPDTGAGEMALLIAIVLALISSFVVYRRTGKNIA